MSDLSRRAFLAALGAAATTAPAACSDDGPPARATRSTTTSAGAATTTTRPAPVLAGDPFTLGVASGDPLHDRVVLWTRLAPTPGAVGGGMPPDEVDVVWQVAEDDRFDHVVASGVAVAAPDHAHAVHVDATGLAADRWYWYRFRVGDHVTPPARTRTLPEPGSSPDRLRFAVASCQDWEDGWYTAWGDVAEHDLDLVLFLGDYIYERGPGRPGPTVVRQHDSPEVADLDGYRGRYALYRSDPLLRAAHARCPWLVIWDDHEVENDYAADRAQDDATGAGTAAFLARRAAAYRAWWEHMPVRLDPPAGADLRIYRSFRYGDLASIFLLDTRQYRSDQACGVSGISLAPACAEVDDPTRTLTGADEERWLLDGLDESPATWNVLGNQVVMSPIQIGDAILNYDQWDGYRAQRTRLLDHLAASGATNTVVVTGDIHLAGAGTLHGSHHGERVPVATELVGTSISSTAGLPAGIGGMVTASLPDLAYFDADHRGWLRCEVTPERWTAEYRIVADDLVPDSPVSTGATFELRPDRPGPTPA